MKPTARRTREFRYCTNRWRGPDARGNKALDQLHRRLPDCGSAGVDFTIVNCCLGLQPIVDTPALFLVADCYVWWGSSSCICVLPTQRHFVVTRTYIAQRLLKHVCETVSYSTSELTSNTRWKHSFGVDCWDLGALRLTEKEKVLLV